MTLEIWVTLEVGRAISTLEGVLQLLGINLGESKRASFGGSHQVSMPVVNKIN